MARTTYARIEGFLAHRRLAVVGVSRNPQDFTRKIFAEFRRHEYDAVPVNPAAADLEGLRCYASVGEIAPPVEAALLLTPPAATPAVVRDCDAAGIRSVWMLRSSPSALAFCEAHGISAVSGECPFMFLAGNQGPHRIHAFLRRLFGRYPK
jgi:uncharacterized protein